MAKKTKKNNGNLHISKKIKDDEYYTRWEEINAELSKYRKQFEGKKVYCNCDDATKSQFFWWFYINADDLGIVSLEATCYHDPNKDGSVLGHGEYWCYKPENHYDEDVVFEANRNDTIVLDHVEHRILEGNGSYDSPECEEILNNCDIVVTNEPFSLTEHYLPYIVNHGKKFLIIVDKNCWTYKSIFPLIKDNKIWVGYTRPNKFLRKDGTVTNKLNGLCRWMTNLDVKIRHQMIEYRYRYNNADYLKYDNYDAIECGESKAVPCDYTGIIGVPITWLDNYNPDQFEIIGMDRYTVPKEALVGGRVAINGKPTYARILIRWKPEAMPLIEDDGFINYETAYNNLKK